MGVQIAKTYLLGEYRLEPEKRLLFKNGEPVRLTHRPFQVLLYLIENEDRVVTRAELLDRFWDGKDVYDDTLRKCVGAIRKAFDDRLDNPRFIETHYGEGYRYIGPLEAQVAQVGPSLIEIEKTRAVKIVIEEEISDEASAAPPDLSRQVSAVPISRVGSLLSLRAVTLISIFAVVAVAALALYFSRVGSTEGKPLLINSIAVLPLRNLTGDPAQEYFSDGMTESLITELSRSKSLKVISRASVFAFKDREVDPREAGRRLGVAAVLEGSVRKNGDRIRVEVRLVRAEDGQVIWGSDKYDRTLRDVFAVQDEISCSVAANLSVVLCGDDARRRQQTYNVDAYQAYLKGLYYWNKRTAEGIKKAIEHFNEALALDPDYALAYTGLASSYKLGVWYIPLPANEAFPKLKEAAMRSIELDDMLADSHLAMAEVYSFEWRWPDAIREHEWAIRLNGGNAPARHSYGLTLALIGRFDEAIAESKRALELDPLSLIINTDAGWVYYLARRYDEAIEQYRKTLELDSNFSLARFDLGLAYSQVGRHEEAVSEMLKASDRGSEYLAGLGYIYAVAGRRQEALKALAELKRLSERQYVPPYHLAWIYTGLGDKDRAIAVLEKVYEERTQHVVDFKAHPMFDPLRSDLRYQSLVNRVGLPD